VAEDDGKHLPDDESPDKGADETPDETAAEPVDEDASPEIGGTEWLLQQLSGRRAARDEPTEPIESTEPGDSVEAAPSTTRIEQAPPTAPTPTFDPMAGNNLPEPPLFTPPAPDDGQTATGLEPDGSQPEQPRKLRWSWQTGALEEISADSAAPAPAPAPAQDAERVQEFSEPEDESSEPLDEQVTGWEPQPAVQRTADEAETATRAVPVEPAGFQADSEPVTFHWGLTPNDAIDPAVQPELEPEAEAPTAEPAEATQVMPTFDEAEAEDGDDEGDNESEAGAENDAIARREADLDTTAIFGHLPAAEAEAAGAETTTRDELATAALASALPVPPAPSPAARAPETQPTAFSGEADAVTSRRAARPIEHAGRGARSVRRGTRVLFWVAGGLVLVLILIGLFVLGRQLSQHPAPIASPTPTKTATPTPTPTPTVVATGPQAPGKHAWDTLRGGECIQPYSGPWAESFEVVDCAAPHAAQLVYTGVFSADPNAAWPGADQLASQITLLCTKPGIVNLDAAGQLSDVQIQGTYPVTEKQWKDGQRSYFCFVNRASGEPITGSLAGPGPAA
jgi:hypothetical protein